MADTRRKADRRTRRRVLLWWATACAAVAELQRAGEALRGELRPSDPLGREAFGDALTALVTCSEQLATACPRVGFFPDPLAGLPLEQEARRG